MEVGKQLLMTRGSLTTFSIANDVAKYFAIIPAIAIILYSGKIRHWSSFCIEYYESGFTSKCYTECCYF